MSKSLAATHYVLEAQLRRDRVPSFDFYPFSLAAIRHLHSLELHPEVTFLIGENGTGRSTLLEAIAVASLGITGANKAQDLGQAWLMIAVYGVISAAFGGVLRDVVVGEFPLMFKPDVLLAEALFIGSLAFAGLESIGVAPDPAGIIGALIIFSIRMVALAREHSHAEAKAQPVATPR